jgi:RNA polymerase sigma factor (sigma-70 family)
MRQVTIDFPLDTMPPGLIPQKLLRMVSSIKFLRLDIKGFLFTCHVQGSTLTEILKFLRKHYRQVQKGTVKVTHEGHGTILVSGDWSRNGEFLWSDEKGYLSQEKEFSKLMTFYQNRACFLKFPEIIGDIGRFVLVVDPESFKEFEETLRKVDLPHTIRRVSGLEKNVDSAFDRLTPKQMRILRLAYVEGYYRVPRKISTERLAKLLKMEKGNVGEHLRRAEKNIMDFLMTS